MSYLLIWLMALIAFAVLEAVTYQLVCIWFSIGAIGAFLTAYAGLGLDVQLGVFIILSVLALAALRPVSVRLLKKDVIKTNVDAVIGQDVYITKKVNNITSEGEGKSKGLTWTVRSDSDAVTFEPGDTATVVRVEGVKLIVKKKEN